MGKQSHITFERDKQLEEYPKLRSLQDCPSFAAMAAFAQNHVFRAAKMDSLAMRSKLTAIFDADLFALQSALRILDIDCVSAAKPGTSLRLVFSWEP